MRFADTAGDWNLQVESGQKDFLLQRVWVMEWPHALVRSLAQTKTKREAHTPYLPQRVVTLVRHSSPSLRAQQLAWADVRAI